MNKCIIAPTFSHFHISAFPHFLIFFVLKLKPGGHRNIAAGTFDGGKSVGLVG